MAKKRSPQRLNLALQGGGSHGAFTWGALDALLEDGRFEWVGVSGTSAGAMNAAVLASGWARGGAPAAREALSEFWHEVSGTPECFGGWGLPTGGHWPGWMFNRDLWPGFTLWQSWLQQWSPYQLNPFNVDPLRELVRKHVSEQALREGPLQLFITATSVRTGQPRVFSAAALSHDALMASACLPQQAQTVVIDGEPYWDGGFSGNPALWPLIYGTDCADVLLVQINPREQPGIPTTAAEIADRVNEITFNASLVAELRAIDFVRRLLEAGQLDPQQYTAVRLHRVADEAGLAPLDASSKLNNDARLLEQLFNLGRAAAQRWLADDAAQVGRRGSMDVRQTYLAPRQ
ncbi:patatin-like phospholipase family protein [Roseateles sp. BYS180W]|uniref:Patatin-like phospholipase family protein n=1 Tax=Roseateles rivi TaxID=3299028 RepID=A0ABW7FZH2_9BURK